MKEELCSSCGESAQIVRGNYRYEGLGVPIELMHIDIVKCAKCKAVAPIIPNLDGLMTAVALRLIASPSLLGGNEVRFLRKYIGNSARDFSRLLHIGYTHLSKIENEKVVIGAELDKLVRFVAVNSSGDLRNGIDELLRLLPDIEDSRRERKPLIEIDAAELQHQYAQSGGTAKGGGIEENMMELSKKGTQETGTAVCEARQQRGAAEWGCDSMQNRWRNQDLS